MLLRIKTYLFSIMLSLIICSIAIAEDFTTPHTFRPGDVISADMMNELFGIIADAKKTTNSSDFVGTWSCKSLTNNTGYDLST